MVGGNRPDLVGLGAQQHPPQPGTAAQLDELVGEHLAHVAVRRVAAIHATPVRAGRGPSSPAPDPAPCAGHRSASARSAATRRAGCRRIPRRSRAPPLLRRVRDPESLRVASTEVIHRLLIGSPKIARRCDHQRVLLTVTTTHRPATDLGYLLVKHPDRVHSFDVPTGTAHVLYPEATEDRCTAALLLDVDPQRLVRARRSPAAVGAGVVHAGPVRQRPPVRGVQPAGRRPGEGVPQRPARRVEGPARAGRARRSRWRSRCRCCAGTGRAADRAVRAARLDGHRHADPAGRRAGGPSARRRQPATSTSTLTGTLRLADALNHLYVLLPVLDDAKHYWVAPGRDRQAAAGRRGLAGRAPGEGADHPPLSGAPAVAGRQRAGAARPDRPDTVDAPPTPPPTRRPSCPSCAGSRWPSSAATRCWPRSPRPARPGCSTSAAAAGRCSPPWSRTGASPRSSAPTCRRGRWTWPHRRLRLDRLPERQRDRVTLWQSALTYRDDRLRGFDAAVLMEVIEHVDPPRLPALEAAVFGHARPDRGRRDHAERRVQRALRGPDRHAALATTASSGPAPSSRTGPPASAPTHGYAVSFRGVGDDRRAPTGCPDPAGASFTAHQEEDRMTELDIPELALVALVGISGSGQVHLRPAALRAHPGALLRLLPRPGRRRRERPVRLRRRLRRAALRGRQAARGRPAHRRRRHQPAAARPRRPGQGRPRARRAAGRHRAGRARVAGLGAHRRRRADRTFGRQVLTRMHRDLRRSRSGSWPARASARSTCCAASRRSTRATIRYEKLFNDKRDVTGPFDIIGDVHGCRAELETLLTTLGYALVRDEPGGRSTPCTRRAVPRCSSATWSTAARTRPACCAWSWAWSRPARRSACPATTSRSWPASSTAATCSSPTACRRRSSSSQREDAGVRHRGRHASSTAWSATTCSTAASWWSRTPGSRRRTRAARPAGCAAFALYGETTGETDEYGLPVRYPWARDYRGSAAVVYGHTPTPEPEWINNTICLDTGCVFGGELTALRWPTRELVVGAGRAGVLRPGPPAGRRPTPGPTRAWTWPTSPAAATSTTGTAAPPSPRRTPPRRWR